MPKLADFQGRWRFQRRIEGLSGAPGRLFDGIATFSPRDGGLLHAEAGEAQVLGRMQRLLWRAEGRGAVLALEDGSEFLRLALDLPVATAFCDTGAARHELSCNFTRWPVWRAIWRLRDATSDTTMITDYRR